jgi:hypothetical protein
VEWFYNQNKRVARVNGEVVSYINYENQNPDKFLNHTFVPDISLAPNNPDNCVDDSLNFTIDGIGGGQYRAPIRDNGTAYNGTLGNFPNEPVPEIPEFGLPIILILMVSAVVVCVAYKRRPKHE